MSVHHKGSRGTGVLVVGAGGPALPGVSRVAEHASGPEPEPRAARLGALIA